MRKTTTRTLFVAVLLCIAFNLSAITYNIVVAKDGTGNYTTLQAAFNAVTDNNSSRTVIYIKNGTYKQVVTLKSTKKNVTIIGESRDGVILTYDNYASKINTSTGVAYGTSGSASNYIYGSGFYALNVTFQNSAGAVGQALAIYVDADKAVFKNCKFIGNQDTYYGGRNRQFFHDCYFEGTTDFLFGPSTSVFETCKLYTKGGSAITAASTESYVTYGYVFLGCTVLGASGVSTCLGRPWGDYAATSYLNCSMTSVIKAVGWSDWGSTAKQSTARYSEYNNTGAGATLSSRPSWIKRLTAAQAANYTILNIFKTTYASSPVTDNWNPNDVINNTKSAFEDDGRVMSEMSIPEVNIYPNPVVGENFYIELKNFETSQEVALQIFSVQGKLVYQDNITGETIKNITKTLASGVYFVSVKTASKTFTQKIIVK
jgi:pectinesterase